MCVYSARSTRRGADSPAGGLQQPLNRRQLETAGPSASESNLRATENLEQQEVYPTQEPIDGGSIRRQSHFR